MEQQSRSEQRIALLSNINMNMVIRMLQSSVTVFQTEGYGNELGALLNPSSGYHAFAPRITFCIMDLLELTGHALEPEKAEDSIDNWFSVLEGALQPDSIYYISDAYLYGTELEVLADSGRKQALEQLWQKRLEKCCETYKNVRIFPYRHLIETIGEQTAFSMKMWYMGKILLSNEAQKQLSRLILEKTILEDSVPKKVLVLDLDNTLWGGLAGEADHTPIVLSEDHSGLAYKNLQRVILQMQKQGVLLAIASKNNEEDALEILRRHPDMLLREEAFAAKRISWKPKHESIREIAEELNLGLDSMVFFDDNPTERQLIKEMLPQVTVPDFPDKPEELAPAMAAIYKQYFEKPALTAEDRQKTAQYAANAERKKLQGSTTSFEDYIQQLRIVVQQEEPVIHTERLLQLLNKTNQFNLTTRRHTQSELAQLLDNPEKRIYFYDVKDRFGDNGLVAAVIVDLGQKKNASGQKDTCKKAAGKEAVRKEAVCRIEEFVMSCRVMGKQIEYAILEAVAEELRKEGYTELRGRYIPSAKNKPVEKLYEQLGYRWIKTEADGSVEYALDLKQEAFETYRKWICVEKERHGN